MKILSLYDLYLEGVVDIGTAGERPRRPVAAALGEWVGRVVERADECCSLSTDEPANGGSGESIDTANANMSRMMSRANKSERVARYRRIRTMVDQSTHIRQTRPARAIGYLLLWMIGVPIPLLLLLYLIQGC